MRLLRRYGKLVVQVMPDHYLVSYGAREAYEYFVQSLDGRIKRMCSPTWYSSPQMALHYAQGDYSAEIHRHFYRRSKFSRWDSKVTRGLKLRKGCNYPYKQ